MKDKCMKDKGQSPADGDAPLGLRGLLWRALFMTSLLAGFAALAATVGTPMDLSRTLAFLIAGVWCTFFWLRWLKARREGLAEASGVSP